MSATVFTGGAVNTYVALTMATALKPYARTGIKANRAYTPKNMMAMATKITGKTFKARDYMGAHDALREWAASQSDSISANQKGGAA